MQPEASLPPGDRLDEGLRAIQQTASQLMHEIAGEVWRAAGGDKDQTGSKILESLSRDQAIRSLIAHADERFQALAVRTARLEDTMNALAESIRQAKEELARGVDLLEEVQRSGAGAEAAELGDIRTQLAQVSEQIAVAFQTLTERDRAIIETVQGQIRGHGELITQEAGRIAQAMQAYVQQGVAAMGQLAGSVQGQMESMGARDDDMSAKIADSVDEQMAALAEQLQLMYERMAIDSTSVTEALTHFIDRNDSQMRDLGEQVQLVHERVSIDTRELASALQTRVLGVARLVRSDSEKLHGALTERTDQLQGALTERTDQLQAAVNEGAQDLRRQLGEVAMTNDEALTRMREEATLGIQGRLDEAMSAIDRNIVRMAESLEGQMDRTGRSVGERAAQAIEVAINERFDDVLARMHASTGSLEQTTAELRRAHQEALEGVAHTLDTRIAGLAKLVRSDNETLVEQIVADQEASKQALRAMKELQASLPVEVIDSVERRMEALAESVQKSNEMLAQRIDRMAETIGERQDNDIQIVIDRMGDAMHALAGLGRPAGASAPANRIELD